MTAVQPTPEHHPIQEKIDRVLVENPGLLEELQDFDRRFDAGKVKRVPHKEAMDRLGWDNREEWAEEALEQLGVAAEWSTIQARAIVNTMNWMASTGFSLSTPVELTQGERYWPVPPLGAFHRIDGGSLVVVRVIDARRRRPDATDDTV